MPSGVLREAQPQLALSKSYDSSWRCEATTLSTGAACKTCDPTAVTRRMTCDF